MDGTLGGGGHTRPLSEIVSPGGHIIAMDRDPIAVQMTSPTLPSNVTAVSGNYADLPEVLDQMEIDTVDGVLLDLGLSSDQLASRERGFSFSHGGTLDLRFNPQAGEPAWRLINRLGEKHLADMIYEFGQERYSRRVARKICQIRHREQIKTAEHLASIVRTCVPKSGHHSIDPATRTFQALRIAVNEELKWLSVAVRRLPDRIAPGGRLAIISFHSLEDRIVKSQFAEDDRLRVLTKRPVTASDDEIERNPRSRSAKLRVAERI